MSLLLKLQRSRRRGSRLVNWTAIISISSLVHVSIVSVPSKNDLIRSTAIPCYKLINRLNRDAT
jgi:hypothetical protein